MVEKKETRRFKDYFERTRLRDGKRNPSKYRLIIPVYGYGQRLIAYSDGEWSANQAGRFVMLCRRLDVAPAKEAISRLETTPDL